MSCHLCSRISIESLCRREGYAHLSDSRGIVDSAETCSFCNLIWRALVQNKSGDEPLDDHLKQRYRENLPPDPITLHGAFVEDEHDRDGHGVASPAELVGIDVHIASGDMLDIVRLGLFSLPGESAPLHSPNTRVSGAFGLRGRPPLHDAGSPEAMALLKFWLAGCLETHKLCRDARFKSAVDDPGTGGMTNTDPQLPTRVLDLGPPAPADSPPPQPKLLISNGRRARYVALSHCWGKTPFLTTTTANIDAHTADGIPASALTKTFRDAMAVTRALGMRYLWIDSLCIVQDDVADWATESRTMGAVYALAELTIAATGARDGSHGCFIPRTPLVSVPLPEPTVPAVAADGNLCIPGQQTPGAQYHAFLYPDEKLTSLTWAPLAERAWITQEWMLGPRVTHFTAARLIWACKTTVRADDGDRVLERDEQRLLRSVREHARLLSRLRADEVDASPISPCGDDAATAGREEPEMRGLLAFYDHWCDLVSTYTGRQLTYERDKPVAIFSLALEIRAATGDEYAAGIFLPPLGDRQRVQSLYQHALAIQLHWYGKRDLARPPALRVHPSWSWLSTMGDVYHHAPARTAHSAGAQLELLDSDSIPSRRSFSEEGRITTTTDGGQVLKGVARIRELDPSSVGDRPGLAPEWISGLEKTRGWHSGYFSASIFSPADANIERAAFVFPGNVFPLVAPGSGNPLGWASLDLGVRPARSMFACALSKNMLPQSGGDSLFDGFNVIFLVRDDNPASHVASSAHDGTISYVRVGAGEILDEAWFGGTGGEITKSIIVR